MMHARTGEFRWPMAMAVLLTGLLRMTLPAQLRLNEARPVLFVVLLVLVAVLILADQPRTLLAAGGAIWLTNVLAFALWYWDLDRGRRGRPRARVCRRASVPVP
jgi:hypothetical protein